MWCDYCNTASYSVQTTIRITKDGKEVVVERCGNCMRRTEIEYIKGPTVSIKVKRAKYPAKRHS